MKEENKIDNLSKVIEKKVSEMVESKFIRLDKELTPSFVSVVIAREVLHWENECERTRELNDGLAILQKYLPKDKVYDAFIKLGLIEEAK